MMKLFPHSKKKDAKANLILLIISLICAVAGWFIVSIKQYPSAHKEIYNIPVVLDLSGTEAAKNGLKVLTPKEAKVNVSFDCSRTDFSNINSSTVRAWVDFSNIDTVGSREMTVNVESTNGMTLSNKVVSPQTITVNLDKFETKTFPIKAKTPNINSVDGMVINDDEITCTPAEVTITAPSTQLSQIAECYAVSEKKETLSRTTNINSESYLFLDENGSPIDQTYINIDSPFVSINLPVLTQKTVNIGVSLGGSVPDNFDPNCLKFAVTPNTATIAANNADANIPDPLNISISLSKLDIGYTEDYDFDKMLTNNNLKNVSGIDKINVSLISDGLASKYIKLTSDNISVTNKPNDNNDYTLLTGELRVKIVGPEDIINDITAQDIQAEVDLLGADTSKDQFKYDVKVFCKTHNNVWAVDAVKVDMLKTPKEGVTTSSSSSSATTTTY